MAPKTSLEELDNLDGASRLEASGRNPTNAAQVRKGDGITDLESLDKELEDLQRNSLSDSKFDQDMQAILDAAEEDHIRRIDKTFAGLGWVSGAPSSPSY